MIVVESIHSPEKKLTTMSLKEDERDSEPFPLREHDAKPAAMP